MHFLGLILFDIDGVIRDVGNSYRLAVKKTVLHFCGEEPSYQEIDNLKNEGIWNNDWDLSLELIKRKINSNTNDFKVPNIFPCPDPIIETTSPRIMSLRDGSKKMSKSETSDMSRINLTDVSDQIALKIRKAKTDQDPIPEDISGLASRPEASNLINIYSSFKECNVQEVLNDFSGKPFSFFKPKLTELIINEIKPISKKINDLLKNHDQIDDVMNNGAQKASEISSPIIDSTFKILGLKNN